MRPQREARRHRAVCRIHQIRGNLHGHILRAGIQRRPAARKGAGLNRSLNHDATRGVPQIKGELGGVRNLVVGVMVGRANAGEVSPAKDPEAGQAVEEVLVRTGQGRLPVAQGVRRIVTFFCVEAPRFRPVRYTPSDTSPPEPRAISRPCITA